VSSIILRRRRGPEPWVTLRRPPHARAGIRFGPRADTPARAEAAVLEAALNALAMQHYHGDR
jgi:hypothetical protein